MTVYERVYEKPICSECGGRGYVIHQQYVDVTPIGSRNTTIVLDSECVVRCGCQSMSGSVPGMEMEIYDPVLEDTVRKIAGLE